MSPKPSRSLSRRRWLWLLVFSLPALLLMFAWVTLSSSGRLPGLAYAQELDEVVYLPFISADVPLTEGTPTPTSTPTEGPSPTATSTPTEGPSPTATSTATEGPSPTATETSTPTDTATAGPSPTATETSTPTDTATAGPSPTATETSTPTEEATETSTPTEEATETSTPTEEATATSTPTETSTPTSEPLPEIANGGFEDGAQSGWTTSSTLGSDLIFNESILNAFAGVTPRTGSWAAWLGGAESETSQLSQSITLPSGSSPTLLYYYQIDSAETTCGNDVFEMRVDGAAVDTTNLCTSTVTSGWTMGSVSLSAYAGQTITITFYVSTDATSDTSSSLFLDDVSLEEGP